MKGNRYSDADINFGCKAPPPTNCPASEMTWYMGANGRDQYFSDRPFRHEIFKKYPKRYSIELAKMYIEVYENESRFDANCTLRFWDSLLKSIDLELAIYETKLIERAEELAIKCRYFVFNFHYSNSRLNILKLIAENRGIDLPDKDTIGILKRLCDEIWWRRNLRKKHRRGLEKAALMLNLVNRNKAPYISNESLKCFKDQKKRNKELLNSMKAVNELNEEFELSEIVEKSLSNPRIRRSELMVRIAGIEKYAMGKNHIGVLFTLTCPSRMHSTSSKSGDRNPKFDNTTPIEAQTYLNNLWARSRSKFKRDNIEIYGVRVVEPHHDGTPHWHMLLFMPPQDYEEVCSILNRYALHDSPNETGATKRRLTAVKIDWNKGSATGYVAKYICKNIDGFGVDQDNYGNDAKSSAERITAWASTWGIRQFQFIGGPKVSIWRELRRLSPDTLPDNLVKQCCIAADDSEWHTFMNLMGGHAILKKNEPITLLKVWSDALGKYGEPLGDTIKGLEYDGVTYISRIHTWTIETVNKQILDEKYLHIGRRRMVSEVERPLLGATREGVAAETIRLRAPMSKTFLPLEFCQ